MKKIDEERGDKIIHLSIIIGMVIGAFGGFIGTLVGCILTAFLDT